MKKTLFLLFLLLNSFTSVAQSRWNYYLSYQNATQVVASGNNVYAVFNGHLLAYDAESQSTFTIDKLSCPLSGFNVRYIGWSDTQKCLVTLYDDNNIDLIYPKDGDAGTGEFSIVNIPQVKSFTDYQLQVNKINVSGDWATLSTDHGIVLINLARREVQGNYAIGSGVSDAVVVGKRIYASKSGAIYSALLTDNLYSLSGWTVKIPSVTVNQMLASVDGSIYLLTSQGSTDGNVRSGLNRLVVDAEGQVSVHHITDWVMTLASINGKVMQFALPGHVLVYHADAPEVDYSDFSMNEAPYAIASLSSGKILAACGYGGLKVYTAPKGQGALTQPEGCIGGFGPRHSGSFSVAINNGNLYVCGGRVGGSGRHEGFFGRYDGNSWNDMEEDRIISEQNWDGCGLNAAYKNLSHVAFDPHEDNHAMVSSYANGLYEYNGDKFSMLYNCDNSPIKKPEKVDYSSRNKYALIGGCVYDAEGNLWFTNNYCDTILVVKKTDGSWQRIFTDDTKQQNYAEKLMFDSRGWLWGNVRVSTSEQTSGFFCLDYNGTISNQRDDRSKFRNSAVNEDGTTCSLTGVYAIVEDKNQHIWIGCSEGVFEIEDPEMMFSASGFTVNQPKVPRNDGTNYADYLLTGVTTSALAVDGGNRKWIGTMGGGLYLVSADGTEIISHFTTDDTPILSNNIFDLKIDDATGVLYIATDEGLCSYRTNVTAPIFTLSKNNIKVYPNPVRPEYSGVVTISGIPQGAEVKVMTTGGQLVARGNAVGGSWQWDLTQQNTGQRVGAGLYYLMVATADGKQSAASKVVII